MSFYEVLAARGGDVYETSFSSNVPTFATSRLQEILAAKSGPTWREIAHKCCLKNARLPRNIQGSFTRRKSTTWDKRFYFPSEGRRAEDFFALKNPTASAGFEPANLGATEAATTTKQSTLIFDIFNSAVYWASSGGRQSIA